MSRTSNKFAIPLVIVLSALIAACTFSDQPQPPFGDPIPDWENDASRPLWPDAIHTPDAAPYEDGHGDGPDAGFPPGNEDAGFGFEDAGFPGYPDAGSPGYPDAGYPQPDATEYFPDECIAIEIEAVCSVTVGCEALYTGVGCTCDMAGCVCDSWEFSRCE